MKKALLIIGMIVIFFAGCKKDDILEASKVEMKDVTMERGWEHVKISGEYSYPQALEGMKILVSSNENMSGSVEYVCALEGKKFDVTIDNLEAGVTYYYRYEYDNGYDKARGDKENFVTVRKPIVVTNNIVNVTKNSAVLSGSVTNNDVENKINVRGFCWSKNTPPTISGSHNNNGSSSGTGISSFTYNLSYLESNTKYYVRTYARTDWGVVYGEVKSFVTMREEPEVPEEPEIVLPTVTTNSVTNITANSATCGGNVTSDGNGTVSARGICWSETSEPKINNLYSEESNEGTGTGSFTSSMTNLKANTTYYVRAYATNEAGTVYGEVKSFKTLEELPEIVLPTVTTNSVTNITSNSATCGGNVTSDGNGTVTARGICWSETSEPKINNLYSEESNEGTGTGSFTSSMTNLKANTTYYVRAYATNEAGTIYGEVKSFKTLEEEPEETISGTENGHNYVDLGLPSGLKWATCNVGASTSTDYGHYYAWGETTTKTEYTEDNSLTYGKQMNDISGNSQYDAATANWGGTWRMPTKNELNELRTKCTWTWTTRNGVKGHNVEGPNGNSIFLPAAGYRDGSSYFAGSRGYYWSSTADGYYNDYAYYLIYSDNHAMLGGYRYDGRSVRPVFGGNFTGPEEQPIVPENIYVETISGTENGHNYVDLGLPSGLKWATCNVGASKATAYGNYYAWGETTTKYEYTEDNSLTYGKQMNDISGNAQYDAATANWGGEWRMPNEAEVTELLQYCTWTWIIQDGINGYMVEGPNGNSIFLSAAGWINNTSFTHTKLWGGYWISTPDYIESETSDAFRLLFNTDYKGLNNGYSRDFGHPVRPVFDGNFEGPEEQPEEPETPSANQSFTVNGVTFTMIAVEGGTFKMGAQSSDSGGDNYDSDAYSKESPVHDVTLSSYYIGETEVTQELWEAVMGSNPSFFSGYPQRPVETVSWNDCQTFIEKLNQLTGKDFRLPTEAEWEYAARGGNKSKGYKYSGSNTLEDVAWYNNNSNSTHNVKTKLANELGIYDMSGNVWEWCQDWYESYSSGSQTDPTGPTSGSSRVLRGGSWNYNARLCRVSYRSDGHPGIRDNFTGFRLILQELQ